MHWDIVTIECYKIVNQDMECISTDSVSQKTLQFNQDILVSHALTLLLYFKPFLQIDIAWQYQSKYSIPNPSGQIIDSRIDC